MKQRLGNNVVIHPSSVWRRSVAGIDLNGRGSSHLLDAPLMAFFASRQCTGWAIRAGLEWALSQARSHSTVVSGFQSPLERSVLELLLEAGSPAVLVLGRPVESARLPAAWSAALERQHLTIISVLAETRRLDREGASTRNEIVAQLAHNITIAHAAPGGRLETHVKAWRSSGKSVHTLDVA